MPRKLNLLILFVFCLATLAYADASIDAIPYVRAEIMKFYATLPNPVCSENEINQMISSAMAGAAKDDALQICYGDSLPIAPNLCQDGVCDKLYDCACTVPAYGDCGQIVCETPSVCSDGLCDPTVDCKCPNLGDCQESDCASQNPCNVTLNPGTDQIYNAINGYPGSSFAGYDQYVICVNPGVYNEPSLGNSFALAGKNGLTLKGINVIPHVTGKPQINIGSGNGMSLASDYITINNLELFGSVANNLQQAITVLNRFDRITDNKIHDVFDAVVAESNSLNVLVSYNTFYNIGGTVFECSQSKNAEFSYNEIANGITVNPSGRIGSREDKNGAIYLDGDTDSRNMTVKIKCNYFHDCSQSNGELPAVIGIAYRKNSVSHNDTITNNYITDDIVYNANGYYSYNLQDSVSSKAGPIVLSDSTLGVGKQPKGTFRFYENFCSQTRSGCIDGDGNSYSCCQHDASSQADFNQWESECGNVGSEHVSQCVGGCTPQCTGIDICDANSCTCQCTTNGIPTQVGIGQNNLFSSPTNSIDLSGNYAFMGRQNGVVDIFDISNPKTPSLVTYYQGAGSPIYNINISGSYMYLSEGNISAIVDISNLNSLNTVFTYNLTSKGSKECRWMEAKDGYAYMFEQSSLDQNTNITIFDVSNPVSPIRVGSVTVSNGGGDGMAIYGNYVYTTNLVQGITVTDISDKAHPVFLKDIPGMDAEGPLTVSGNHLYVPDNSLPGFRVLSLVDPTTPTLVGSYTSVAPGANGSSVFIKGSYAYLSAKNGGLQIVDITNPSNPRYIAKFISGNPTRQSVVVGRYVYVADWSTELRIIDVCDV